MNAGFGSINMYNWLINARISMTYPHFADVHVRMFHGFLLGYSRTDKLQLHFMDY